MNVLIYARDSDSKQADKGLSIPGQLRAVRESCEPRGDIILREFVDDGYSGTTDKRPAFQEMMRYCKANADVVDAILVWKFNRFARDRVDSAVYKRYLKKLGVKVISITEPISEGIDADVLEGVIEIMDSRFSKSLAQDVMRGMSEVAKRGFYPFAMPPYGYTKEEIRDGRAKRFQLRPDPSTSPLIRRIFKLYTKEGLGAKAIAKKLNEERLRTSRGSRWSTKAILYILGNPVYAGTLTVKYKTQNAEYLAEKDRLLILENAHEPLVDRDTFDRAQAIRAERQQATPNALASQYLLSGLLRCKRCGRKLYGASAKSGEHHYYACRGYLDSGKATCDLGLVPREKLDAIVVEKIRDVLLEPEHLEQLAGEVNEELGDRRTVLDQRLELLTTQIKKTEHKIGKLLDALENEELSPAAIRPRLQERQEELEQLRAQKLMLKAEDPASHVLTIEMDRVLPYVEDLKATLSTAPIKTRRFILKSFIKQIVVGRREITIEFSIPQETDQEQRHRTGVLGTVTSGTPQGTTLELSAGPVERRLAGSWSRQRSVTGCLLSLPESA